METSITVSLDNWEKKLLSSFQESFGEDIMQLNRNSDRQPLPIVDSWFWSRKIRNTMEEVFEDNYQQSGYEGNPPVGWHRMCQRLSSHQLLEEGNYSCHSRVARLLKDNPKLQRHFEDMMRSQIYSQNVIKPKSEDEPFWTIIADIVDFLPLSWRGLTEDQSPKDFIGTYLVLADPGAHAIEHLAKEFHEMRDISDSAAQPQRSSAQSEDNNSNHSDCEPTIIHYREFDIWSLIRMAALLCRRRLQAVTQDEKESPLTGFLFPPSPEDPGKYLENIPFGQIESPKDMSAGCKLFWKPTKSHLLDHHLFTEEEVFKYCVENEFVFPGYREERSVVFIASDLKTSLLGSQLPEFQTCWKNDCAITVDPTSGTWYILETIPGIKFRAIIDKMGIQAARAHFRRIVDEHRLGRSTRLKDILQGAYEGQDLSNYEKYEGIIDAIDFAEITSYDGTALGGQSGEVYRAEWNCPQKVDMLTEKTQKVVLKKVWPPGKRTEVRLFRELDLTFQASVKQPSGLAALYGLTRAPWNHRLSESNSKNTKDRQDSIFLVFESAEKKLTEYLEESLTGMNEDWDVIAYLFQDLANSIGSIHQQKIVHRDIHLDNILIREKTYLHDPFMSSGPELVIIDFGESRIEETLHQSYNPYGNGDFWAPEVKEGSGWSLASDIYAIGCAMERILELRYKIAARASSDGASVVPKPLLDAVDGCLHCDPTKRPTAKDLESEIDTIIESYFRPGGDRLGRVDFENADFVDLYDRSRYRNDDLGEEDAVLDEW